MRNNQPRPLDNRKVELIAELSFLKIFVSWEVFLEQTFIRYMCGARTSSGYSPGRHAYPRTATHAFEMIAQGRSYLDWTKGREIVDRANTFFQNGEPFAAAIQPALVELEEMRVIRNRIAHVSRQSKNLFSVLVRDKIGHVPQGMTPGRFLLCKIPANSPENLLENYVDLLLIVGDLLVP